MTLSEAAKQWLAARADAKDAERRVDEAAEVLKEYFRRSGKTKFRGVGYAMSTYTTLDLKKARALLGAKAVEAEVPRTRETLSPVE